MGGLSVAAAAIACVVASAAGSAPTASAFAAPSSLGRLAQRSSVVGSSRSSPAGTERRMILRRGTAYGAQRGIGAEDPLAWRGGGGGGGGSWHSISMTAKQEEGGVGGGSSSSSSSGSGSKLLSFLCPLLKLLADTDPSAPRNQLAEDATIAVSTASRWLWGRKVSPMASSLPAERQPLEPIILYEFEACPFCRRVRETLTYLDLEAEIRPCPKGSLVHRAQVLASGGKETFPFIRDCNTGVEMYESGDIVKYLVETYGGGSPIPPFLLESTLLSGWVPTLARAGRGMTRSDRASASSPSPGAISLFGFEGDGGSRLVRESLCELELPYRLVNVGEGSGRGIQKLQDAGGSGRQLPFLVDSAAGVSIQGARDIMHHLFDTYMIQQNSG
jgi:glutaredoxin